MSKLHNDYYLRKCCIEKNEVPSQSVMKKKMGPALANIYFKSMTPKLKMIAGLEPPLKGGGNDWFVPPDELLRGRSVLKPVQRKFLSKLGCDGIICFGEKFIDDYNKILEAEKQKLLLENDLKWKETIQKTSKEMWKTEADKDKEKNTKKILQAFYEFTNIYQTSLTNIESLLTDAGLKEIERIKKETFDEMSEKCKILQKQQYALMHNQYKEKLNTEKNKHKEKFIEELENLRTAWSIELHDLNLEKHSAVEKLRILLEYQNLASQVYVALKERIALKKELEISQHKHKKAIKKISDHINTKDFEIKLAKEKEKKQHEFNRIWQKKICHVVKRFQEFVKYCLNTIPHHADFFINMEKLMLLQLSEALYNPSVKNMFEPEIDRLRIPIARPHPFYLVCDKGFKPQVDQNLCPKHCTSSASQLPVIIVNKRCVYAACDNLEVFGDKVKQFLDGQRGNDEDFIDDHDYTYDVPINCTSSDQLLQLQLESSLMQILQNELPNVKQLPIECLCNPYCVCSPTVKSKTQSLVKSCIEEEKVSLKYEPSGEKITERKLELNHMREPKINSYLKYIQPQKCQCAKLSKKHLREHLPAYMRNNSEFDQVYIPHYEICDLNKLRTLVKKCRNVPPKISLQEPETNMKDVSTQNSDMEFNALCNCYSNEELEKILKHIRSCIKLQTKKSEPYRIFDGFLSSSHLEMQPSVFATEAALTLNDIINKSPELEEIFIKEDCTFDK